MSATETIQLTTNAAAAAPAGLLLGRALPYPEKSVRPPTGIEAWLRHAASLMPRPQALTRRSLARVALLSQRQDPSTPVASLRAALRQGFAPEPTARAFAVISHLSQRILGLRPHPVQLMAATAMLRGNLAELATGEGKTLAAAIAAATAAVAGRMVHVVTVNDYLATRDHAQLSPLYAELGLTCGLIVQGQKPADRASAYACDIVYASNKELVFDYLRDSMRRRSAASALHARIAQLDRGAAAQDGLLLRGLDFVIVDEADSVLIDEARTPLIISANVSAAQDQAAREQALNLVAELREGEDFTIDRSARRVNVTQSGQIRVEQLSNALGGAWDSTLRRSELVAQALTARLLFLRDEHYLLRDGKVQIIDEYTGRIMPDRFWNDGLHQMIEAKEGVAASHLRESVARITYQRFFGRYRHLCGMSGTLAEVGSELRSVYGVGVIPIPTHHPCRRTVDRPILLRSEDEKWRRIAKEATRIAAAGRPVLIGTRSVAASVRAGDLLHAEGVAHSVLNAAQDAEEAAIVARAGTPGHVTIATNMAGRGTDIRLSPGLAELGGLAVILSDRHDAARIDRQLAGRGARQGDRGSYMEILSLEDALMDPLATSRAGRMVLALAGTHQALAQLLFNLMQRGAERRHRLVRRELLRAETRLQDSLSFAGRPD